MYNPAIIAGLASPGNYKSNAPVTQKTGGQVSILGGIAQDIGLGVREYTRARIAQEIQRAQPGVTYDPLNAPYNNPADGGGYRAPTGEQAAQGDAAGALVLAAIAGAALAFI